MSTNRKAVLDRIQIIVLGLIGLLLSADGCTPTAPSVAGGAPTVTWDHLRTENWQYELQDAHRIATYSFRTHGNVFWSEGTRQGNVEGVVALAGSWRIDRTGDLVISNKIILRLISLTSTEATVQDVGTGSIETYTRSYHP